MPVVRLSPHFTLAEMTVTRHRHINNTPTEEALVYLAKLAIHYLESLRAQFGPIRVTSGYRSPALNAAIPGAAKDSAHSYGCAADVQSIYGAPIVEMMLWVIDKSGFDYDQIIDEERGGARWMHLGILRPRHEPAPRHQALVMRGGTYSRFA